jgi:hypothetical protein
VNLQIEYTHDEEHETQKPKSRQRYRGRHVPWIWGVQLTNLDIKVSNDIYKGRGDLEKDDPYHDHYKVRENLNISRHVDRPLPNSTQSLLTSRSGQAGGFWGVNGGRRPCRDE